MNKMSYKTSGVDIQKANAFIQAIDSLVSATHSGAVLKQKGGFGSLFSFDAGAYRFPVLVSSADGVGTKLMIASLAGLHDTVGVDLVAMNVNDVVCSGARPLFFLDYIACGRLDPAVLKKVMAGIARGCRSAGCSLIGGETAEMAGMYKGKDYDLAGFVVGVVERGNLIDGRTIQAGDVLIGLGSNGLHSNGFSLVRKVFSEKEQKRHAEELLKPTRIYVKPVLRAVEKFAVKGIAHMTGGSFYEKLTKIIPSGCCALIRRGSWEVPPIFRRIQHKGNIDTREMFRVFNMGIGMVLAVSRKDAAGVRDMMKRMRVPCRDIGEVVKDKARKIHFQ